MIPPVMPVYGTPPFDAERGDGAYLWSTDGTRYLDFGAGIAVNALGHAHPRLVQALTDQAQRLWHTSNLYGIPGQRRVADLLVANSFADSVFFCNSGAEALEGSFKMTRRYQNQTGHPERYRILCTTGSFHGRTLATIAAAGNPKYLDGFGPAVDGFDQVPFGNMNELRAAITAQTAGILVEPIQGEGGINPARLDYLRALRAAADEFGLLLILDEVQCGIGRTGKLFAHQWADITPDLVASAKGLGGGFPVGAVLATEPVAATMTAGVHGTTFGGNPLAMAAAEAVLETVLAPGFLGSVDRIARRFWHALRDLVARHPAVLEDVRGAGLMLGLKCRVPTTDMVARLRDNGLLVVPAADGVIRLLPPLIVGDPEIDDALAILETTCTALAADLKTETAA